MFKNIENDTENKESKTVSEKAKEQKLHVVEVNEFMSTYFDLCIYDIPVNHPVEIVEHAPQLFKDIRAKYGIPDDILFNSFAPIHNIQAIHNFFTGSGKSESFFFFSDNKIFALKTLKECEKQLLLDTPLLENYYHYLMGSEQTLLSKFYGVYSIRI